MFHSGNPTLSENVFRKPQTIDDLDQREAKLKQMTVSGTVTAMGMLLATCSIVAILAWSHITANPSSAGLFAMLGGLGGLVLALTISFLPKTAPFLGFVYAALQGLFLSAISYVFAGMIAPGEDGSPNTGMIFQAVLITFAIFGGMLIAYSAGLIRIGGTVAKVLITALFGVMAYGLIIFVANGFFGANLPNMFDPTNASPISIGFSVVVIGLGALLLVLDFQFIEAGAKSGAPKYMEWYGAFGLLVTLVWIYIEVLRLLTKLRSSE